MPATSRQPGGWFADRSVSGGGPLIDVGVHFIDIAWWLMGMPTVVSVTGFTSDRVGDRGNIENLTRWRSSDHDAREHRRGPGGSGHPVRQRGCAERRRVLLVARPGRGRCAALRDRGGAELEPELLVFTEQHDTIVTLAPQIDSTTFEMEAGFQNEIDGFVAAVRDGTPSAVPATHGLVMTKILAAIYESAASGHEVVVA